MKATEKTLVVLIAIGLAMIFLNIAGGGLLTTVSVSALTVVYYFGPLLFNGVRLRHIVKKGAFDGLPVVAFIAAFFAGFALCAVLLGSLFKFQLWPGGTFLILAGLCAAAVMSAVCYGISEKHKIALFSRYVRRAVPICAIGLLLYITPVNLLIDMRYDDPREAEIVKKMLENPHDEELQQELNELQKAKYE